MSEIDGVLLAFDAGTLVLLNAGIGLIMFGVAIDLRVDDFRAVARKPRGFAIGLTAQFLVLPAATYLLTRIIDPLPSIALGMILVAACPGGNISNIITHLAGGNAALSIGMTAVSTAAAVVMTPLNITFWGGMHPSTAAILQRVSLDPVELLVTVVTILGVPLVVGMTVAHRWPAFATAARRPMKVISVVFFLAIVGLALSKNWGAFLSYVGVVMGVVALHNATALGLGYGSARAVGLAGPDARAIAIEVGIQNSALGLTLIFTFFGGLGGMALVAGWWGIWHIVAGLTLAGAWSAWDRRVAPVAGEASP